MTVHDQAQHDLERFLDDKVETLGNDLLWRCRAAGLSDRQFRWMLMGRCLWTAAQCIALGREENDEIYADAFVRLVRKARAEVKAQKSPEPKPRA